MRTRFRGPIRAPRSCPDRERPAGAPGRARRHRHRWIGLAGDRTGAAVRWPVPALWDLVRPDGRSAQVRAAGRGNAGGRSRHRTHGPGRMVGSDLVRWAELVHAGGDRFRHRHRDQGRSAVPASDRRGSRKEDRGRHRRCARKLTLDPPPVYDPHRPRQRSLRRRRRTAVRGRRWRRVRAMACSPSNSTTKPTTRYLAGTASERYRARAAGLRVLRTAGSVRSDLVPLGRAVGGVGGDHGARDCADGCALLCRPSGRVAGHYGGLDGHSGAPLGRHELSVGLRVRGPRLPVPGAGPA